MEQSLNSYVYTLVPTLTWVLAQFCKIIINGVMHNDWSWRYIYRSGGMPSVHTSVIVALCTVLGFRLGVASPEFGIATVLAFIVMYDALNVRHAVGEQANVLRLILPKVFKKAMPAQTMVHQSNGHTLIEVLAGLLIGVIIPLLLLNVL